MNSSEKKETKPLFRIEKPGSLGMGAQVLLSFLALFLGALLTFVPNMTARTLCYVFSLLLCAGGAASVIYYFVTKGWKHIDDYNFAVGVMLLILGFCGFARVEGMEERFVGYFGFMMLAIGIMELQNCVQLRVANHSAWLPVLVFTLLTLFAGVVMILDLRVIWELLRYWLLIISGALGLVSIALAAIAMKRDEKKAAAQAQSAEENNGAGSE